jgi:hypothetical protein
MKKIAIKYGLWMLAGFIAFFLLMHLVGLSTHTYLRVFNGVIHMGFMWAAIRQYRERHPDSVNNYVSGVAMGMWTSAIGVLGFVIFMFFFFDLNPGFLDAVQDQVPIGNYLTPLTATFFILVEGVAISLIGAYIVTRVVDMRMAKASSYED